MECGGTLWLECDERRPGCGECFPPPLVRFKGIGLELRVVE